MKKLFIIVLTILIFSLTACTKPEEDIDPDPLECEPGYVEVDGQCEEEDVTLYCTDEIDNCIEEVERILAGLNLTQKAAQMVQAERGSITPADVKFYGIGSILSGGGSHPDGFDSSVDDWYQMYADYQNAALDSTSGIPIIYGIDAVHGNNNLYGATIFPHNIGLGMANNPELTYAISKATAEEMLVTGINWTFAPALSVVQNIKWGRTYEGYSENPEIHANLTQSAILGFEENGVSATAKHYFADGGTANGDDQGNVLSSDEAQLRAIHLAPYYDAIEAGVDTIMISYSSINSEKMHGSSYWIQDVLKDEMGFEGFIISDWNAIHQLPGSFREQIIASINAGVDMLMEPTDWKAAMEIIFDATLDGDIARTRVDDAVRRILTVKYNRGLLDDPLYQINQSELHHQEHQDLARQAVRESLVLLKNENNSLPLEKSDTIYITGPASNNVGLLCGGWTRYWQGTTDSSLGVGSSIRQELLNILSSHSGTLATDWQSADTVIVVLAENPYSEGVGDNDNMTLTGGNAHSGNAAALALAAQAQAAGKNVVGILISGRPLLLEDYLQHFDSFVAAWLPGTAGGKGINDVIFGDYDFVGKLSYTWPLNLAGIGYTSNEENYDVSQVLYPYGYGLRYTQNEQENN